MNIYLLPRRNNQYFLFSDGLKIEPEKPEDKEEVENKTFAGQVKKGFKKITKPRKKEQLLKEMSEIEKINIHYSAHLAPQEAKNIYEDLIQRQIKKHKKWMIADGLLVPISAVFSLIPGPNLLLAYLAWRTAAHYKTKKRGENVHSKLDVNFVKEENLTKLLKLVNQRFALNRKKKIRKIGEAFGIENLNEQY
jgi:hypothetical protein